MIKINGKYVEVPKCCGERMELKTSIDRWSKTTLIFQCKKCGSLE